MSHSQNVNTVEVGGTRTVEDLLRWELENGEFAYSSISKDNKMEVTNELNSLRSENQSLKQSICRLLNYIGKADLDYVSHFLINDKGNNSVDSLSAGRENEGVVDDTAETVASRLDYTPLDLDVDSNFGGKTSIQRLRNIKNVNNAALSTRADRKAGEDRDSLMTNSGDEGVAASSIQELVGGKESSDSEEYGRSSAPSSSKANMDSGGVYSDRDKPSNDNNNSANLNRSTGSQISKENKPRKLARDPWAGFPGKGKKGSKTTSLAKSKSNANETVTSKNLQVEVHSQLVAEEKEPNEEGIDESTSQPLVSDANGNGSLEMCRPEYQEVQENIVEEECNKYLTLEEEHKQRVESSTTLKEDIGLTHELDHSNEKSSEDPCILMSNFETEDEESKYLRNVEVQDVAPKTTMETAPSFSARPMVEISSEIAKCDKEEIDIGVAVAAREGDKFQDQAVTDTESYVEKLPCGDTIDTGNEVEGSKLSDNIASEDNVPVKITSCCENVVKENSSKDKAESSAKILKLNGELPAQELSTGATDEGIFLSTTETKENSTVDETIVSFTKDGECLQPCVLVPEREPNLTPSEFTLDTSVRVVAAELTNNDTIVDPREQTVERTEDITMETQIDIPAALFDSDASAKSITSPEEFSEEPIIQKQNQFCFDHFDEIKDIAVEVSSLDTSCKDNSVIPLKGAAESADDASDETDASIDNNKNQLCMQVSAIVPSLEVDQEVSAASNARVTVNDAPGVNDLDLTVGLKTEKDVKANLNQTGQADSPSDCVENVESTNVIVVKSTGVKPLENSSHQTGAGEYKLCKNEGEPDVNMVTELRVENQDIIGVESTLPTVEAPDCSIADATEDADGSDHLAAAGEITAHTEECIQVPDIQETTDSCLDASAKGEDISVPSVSSDTVNIDATITSPDIEMDIAVDESTETATGMAVVENELSSPAIVTVLEVESDSVCELSAPGVSVEEELPEVSKDHAEVEASMPAVEAGDVDITRVIEGSLQEIEQKIVEKGLGRGNASGDISTSAVPIDTKDVGNILSPSEAGIEITLDKNVDSTNDVAISEIEIPSLAGVTVREEISSGLEMNVPDVNVITQLPVVDQDIIGVESTLTTVEAPDCSIADGTEDTDLTVLEVESNSVCELSAPSVIDEAELPEVNKDNAKVEASLPLVDACSIGVPRNIVECGEVRGVQSTIESCLDASEQSQDRSSLVACSEVLDMSPTLTPAQVDIGVDFDERSKIAHDVAMAQKEVPTAETITVSNMKTDSICQLSLPAVKAAAELPELSAGFADVGTSQTRGKAINEEVTKAIESLEVQYLKESVENPLDVSDGGADHSAPLLRADTAVKDINPQSVEVDVGISVNDIVDNKIDNVISESSSASVADATGLKEMNSIPEVKVLDASDVAEYPVVDKEIPKVDTSLPVVGDNESSIAENLDNIGALNANAVAVDITKTAGERIQIPHVQETDTSCLIASDASVAVSVPAVCTDSGGINNTLPATKYGLDVALGESEKPSFVSTTVPSLETDPACEMGLSNLEIEAELPEEGKEVGDLNASISADELIVCVGDQNSDDFALADTNGADIATLEVTSFPHANAVDSTLPLKAEERKCDVVGQNEIAINADTVEEESSLDPGISLPDNCLDRRSLPPLHVANLSKAGVVEGTVQGTNPKTAKVVKTGVDLEALSNESLVDDIPTSVEEANKRLQAQVKEFTGREKILKGILAVKYKEAEELRIKVEDNNKMIEAMKQIIEANKLRENYLMKLCQENKQKNTYLTRELEKSKAALNELQRSRVGKEELESVTETSGSQFVSTPIRSLSFSKSNSGSEKPKEKRKKRRKTFSFLMCTDSPDRRGDSYDAPVERKEVPTEEMSEYVTDFSLESPSKR